MITNYGRRYWVDYVYGGNYRLRNPISEPVKKNNIPGAYRLRFFDQLNGRFVRETWSGTDGTWEISWISNVPIYFGVAFDHDPNLATRQDGIVRTYLTAEIMP